MTDPSYRAGDFYRICDLSGWKVRASQTVKQWDGSRVYWRFAETRNPQDFVRGVRDPQTVRDPRPEATDVFLTDNQVTAASL